MTPLAFNHLSRPVQTDVCYTCRYDSPVGRLELGSDGEHLVGLWMDGQRFYAHGITGTMEPAAHLGVFDRARDWLDRYFAGEPVELDDMPLAPTGTDYQRAVWDILCDIPYGCLVTYGFVAEQAAARIGKERGSARAAGGAVGRNPVGIIIPCHRVVGANKNLTGYGGRMWRKVELLKLEGINMDDYTVPTTGTAI